MLTHDRIIFHELQLVSNAFGILSFDIVKTSACLRHQSNQNRFPLRHAVKNNYHGGGRLE